VKLAVHGVDGCVNHFATAAKKSQHVDKFLVVAAQTCANDFGMFAVLTERFDGLPQRNGPVCINGSALLGFRETRLVTGSFSGDGRLTDGQGRTVSFTNTVLIMTSNVRSIDALRDVFRPEFLNRIDEIVEFEPLTQEQIGEIVELQLRRLEARLAERGLRLELSDEARVVLAEAGWDPTYGARPLKRAIQRLLENPLALRLLEGEFTEGDTVRVDVKDGELTFLKAAAAEPAAA
jgi:hypothetical protein